MKKNEHKFKVGDIVFISTYFHKEIGIITKIRNEMVTFDNWYDVKIGNSKNTDLAPEEELRLLTPLEKAML